MELILHNCYKGKEDALERGSYRACSREYYERSNVYRLHQGTTDAIFIMQQITQEVYWKEKKIHFMFADLEKDFSRIPIKVLW